MHAVNISRANSLRLRFVTPFYYSTYFRLILFYFAFLIICVSLWSILVTIANNYGWVDRFGLGFDLSIYLATIIMLAAFARVIYFLNSFVCVINRLFKLINNTQITRKKAIQNFLKPRLNCDVPNIK